jgi:hypothetical protein
MLITMSARSKSEAYHIGELEKAAQIVNHDLSRITPAGFQKLREDLFDFVRGSGLRVAESIPLELVNEKLILKHLKEQRQAIPDADVGEIFAALKTALTGIAKAPAGFQQDAHVSEGTFTLQVTKGTLTLKADDKASPFKLGWNFPAKEAALLALYLHLAGSGLDANRIRICPQRGCSKVFIIKAYARDDRERFCSPRCARNAATDRYRGKKKAKAKRKRGNGHGKS